MKKWKRFRVLAFFMAAMTIAGPAFAVTHPFVDVYGADERYNEAVNYLYEEGIVSGKTSTQFDLYSPISRGDAAVMIARALRLDTVYAPDAGFRDVPPRIQAYINALKAEGLVSGYNDGTFRPHDFLTRGAAASLLVRAFDVPLAEEPSPFTDSAGVFKPYIDAMYAAGLTNGVSETRYGTHYYVKRGDYAVLLYKTIQYQLKTMYTPDVTKAEVAADALHLTFAEAVPDVLAPKYIVGEHLTITVQFDGSTEQEPVMIEYYQFNETRDTLTLTVDFSGKSGTVFIQDPAALTEAAFSFD